jgi:hypothetical protein
MSAEEKQAATEQHETINKIANEIDMIKRWWPLFVFIFGVIVATGTVVSGFWKYDNNVVKKPENAKVIDAVSELKLTVLKLDKKLDEKIIKDSVNFTSIYKNSSDVKIQLATDRKYYKQQLEAIKARLSLPGGEQYHYDASGKRIVTYSQNNK